MAKELTQERFERAVRRANDAFWSAIEKEFQEDAVDAMSYDFPPEMEAAWRQMTLNAARAWLLSNHRDREGAKKLHTFYF